MAQVQMLAIMESFSIGWPPIVQKMFDVLRIFIFDMNVLSTSCYFGASLGSKYAPGLLLPTGIVAIMFGLYISSKMLHATRLIQQPASLNNIINTLGLVLSALSIAVFKSIINILECRENPSADATLMNYDGHYCYGDDMMQLLPLMLLAALFFIIGGGAVHSYVVVKGPKMFHSSESFRQRFRFVINRWHPTYYWYGSVGVLRSLCLCLVPVVTTNGLIQLVLTMLVFAPMTLFTIRKWPWREVVANWYDAILSSSFLFILFLAAFLVEPASGDTRLQIGSLMIAGCLVAFGIIVVILLNA
jgi:hypothetical protein